MSFANSNYDVEAQTGQHHPGPHVQSARSIATLSKSLSNFASSLSNLEKLNSQIGTKRDNANLRQRIEKQLGKEDGDLSSLKELIFNLQLVKNDGGVSSNGGSSNNQHELIIQKLQKELSVLSDNFSLLKRKYNEKKNSVIINDLIEDNNKKESSNQNNSNSNSSVNAYSANEVAIQQDSEPTEQTALLASDQQLYTQQQQQQQDIINKYDADFHTLLVQQRAENINEIHQGVREINTIFKDLDSLVQEQGVQIDTVENNLTNLTNDAQNATQELNKANNYQKQKRKYSCITLVVLSVVVLLIVLAIVSWHLKTLVDCRRLISIFIVFFFLLGFLFPFVFFAFHVLHNSYVWLFILILISICLIAALIHAVWLSCFKYILI